MLTVNQRYRDDLYGEYKLEKMLCELIESAPVQRLKGVRQGGACYLVNPKWNVTRYEHSLGVMLLIRRLGGSTEEQITGLLHDVSHTAFSHLIDYVLEKKEEDYHEEIFKGTIDSSVIPDILQKYGYSKEILHQSDYFILEQPLPDLCADRLDYTLRDMYTYGVISYEEVQEFLHSLTVKEDRFFIESIEKATWFVETYYKEVIDFFLHPLNVYSCDELTSILRLALKENIVSLSDFSMDDDGLLAKLKASKHPFIRQGIKELLNHSVQVEENENDYDIHRKSKLRLIDPLVMHKGSLHRASTVSETIQELNRAALQKAMKGVYLKVKKSEA
ncbi:HD domain-containing protein [Fictibacillus sp. NRS-1165]|uniref:HD domain-containing protein n=1 Tax=Fictibacillus sp. NRS-1165 TaxID=3144463 RepID=UPI003D2528BE